MSYTIELSQKDVDKLNQSNFNKDNINKVSAVFDYIVNNPEAQERILQLAVDSSLKM